MTISNKRLATFFLNWWERSEKDFTLSDMEDICKDIGMTRNEFIELVSRSDEFIDKDGWTPEPEAVEKVNTKKAIYPWYAWDKNGANLTDENIQYGEADYIYVINKELFKDRFNDWIITDGIIKKNVLYKWNGDANIEEWETINLNSVPNSIKNFVSTVT